MPEREFEIYLSVLSRLLRLNSTQKDAIADELRDHLEERLADLMASGLSRDDAIKQALDDFGDVSGLALDFTQASLTPLRRIAMRTTLAASALALLVTLGLFLFAPQPENGSRIVAQVLAEETKEVTAPVERKSVFLDDEELFPKFLSEMTAVDFADTPLTDVVQFLGDKHKVTCLIDLKALEAAGIAMDAPVTLSRQSITLEELLTHLLQPLSLGWRVDGDILIVTTIDEVSQRLLTQHYDLAPLLMKGYSLDDLTAAITQAGRNNWEADGTGAGTIITINDSVIVRQNYQGHREISRMLAALEQPQRSSPLRVCSNCAKLEAALKSSSECNFTDTPLADAMTFLADKHGISIELDRADLANANVALDAPITLSLTNKPLHQILSISLKSLNLAYFIRDGVIKVTTQDLAYQLFDHVVYDVRDLVAANSGTTADGEKMSQLKTALLDTTSANWLEKGTGEGAILTTDPGVLVVTQTSVGHAEIETLLNRLRQQARKNPVAANRHAMPQLVTKTYRVTKEAANDLSQALPKLVAVPSWTVVINHEEPSLHVIAGEPWM